jgi:hypothetical protein
MFKRYFEYIGITKEEHPHPKENYKAATTTELARLYLAYLDKLSKAHVERTQTVETKISQIIGQSSVVISISSLFISTIAERFSDINLYFRIYLLVLFAIVFLHFILAINHAIKLLLVDKNRYMLGSTSTVTRDERPTTQLKFLNEEIKDSVDSINFNAGATNKMASNLVYASRCFRLGIWYLVGLTISILLSIAIVKKGPSIMTITNIKELNEQNLQNGQIKAEDEIKQLKAQVDSLRKQSAKAEAKKDKQLKKQ